ncbi:hypothetical protein ACFWA5_14890 [Streptomyces mirabilis]|uniref:hypothetical protein n=1 Tax=Streptomyces mirabilis TaxID=68239 RepID=UPI0036481455
MDEHGHPALIDIEGLIHFDAAWEHVFLRQRFHGGYDAYAALRADGLAGPLRLLDGDFPEPEFMRAIAEHSIGLTLTLLEDPVP